MALLGGARDVEQTAAYMTRNLPPVWSYCAPFVPAFARSVTATINVRTFA